MALKGDKFIRTGIFVEQQHVDDLLDLVNSFIEKTDLPKNIKYGMDFDREIVKTDGDKRIGNTGMFVSQEDFDILSEHINTILILYGMPTPTERCITGIQRNREITISLVTDENEALRK